MKNLLFWVTKIALKSYEMILRVRHAIIEPKTNSPTAFLRHIVESSSPVQPILYNVISNSIQTPKTLILIPFRDNWELTELCLTSLTNQNGAKELLGVGKIRIVLINNRSCEQSTLLGMQKWAKNNGIVILDFDEDFNFSRMNNLAVKSESKFEPELLFFLNNDVSFTGKDDLKQLLDFSAPNKGAWSCTLNYPNQKIQHLFLAPGIKIVGAHPLRGSAIPISDPWFAQAWPVPAVTGAAILLEAKQFAEINGFDESLATAYQDLDLCLRLQSIGYQNWTLGYIQLTHFETATRKPVHLPTEVDVMYKKWGHTLSWHNSLSTELSRWSETPVRRWLEKAYPYAYYLKNCARKSHKVTETI